MLRPAAEVTALWPLPGHGGGGDSSAVCSRRGSGQEARSSPHLGVARQVVPGGRFPVPWCCGAVRRGGGSPRRGGSQTAVKCTPVKMTPPPTPARRAKPLLPGSGLSVKHGARPGLGLGSQRGAGAAVAAP